VRILFVAHTYLRWPGDRAGAQVHRFAKAAIARGDQVLALAPHATGALEGDEILEGVAVRRFRYASDPRERIGYQGAIAKSLGTPAALLVLPQYILRFRAAVRQAVRDFAPDVVSVHWWAPGALATDGIDTPVAVTCHGSDARLLGSNAFIRMIGRPVLRRATAVSAVSEMMAGDLRRYAGLEEVAITRMPVDDALFAPPPSRGEPPVVLFAGNHIRAKGIDLILRAAATVRREGVVFRLRFVGDGPGRPEFEMLANALGISDIVEWAGTRTHDQMPAEFAAASVFILASRGPRGEGLPLTVAESMLSGCAVVATPAGGIPELVLDEVTGLIARDEDADHLALQLGRVLRDPALRARFATAGRARALDQHGGVKANERFFAFLTATAGKGGPR
jgi:glycosyltransferase involved in cell wall biosynthesis